MVIQLESQFKLEFNYLARRRIYKYLTGTNLNFLLFVSVFIQFKMVIYLHYNL
jgi:hypothetical protein